MTLLSRFWFFLVVGVAACSAARLGTEETGGPSLVWPAKFAEGDAGPSVRADAGPPPVASSSAAPAPVPAAPDPAPLAMTEQYEYSMVYDHGAIRVARVRRLVFEKPVGTAREMGRFAIELWIGHELVERVRFDFPMLAAEPPPSRRHPLHEPPSFAAGAEVMRTVLVPASPRATSARLVDRATGRVTKLPWPPDAPLAKGPERGSRAAPASGDASSRSGTPAQ